MNDDIEQKIGRAICFRTVYCDREIFEERAACEKLCEQISKAGFSYYLASGKYYYSPWDMSIESAWVFPFPVNEVRDDKFCIVRTQIFYGFSLQHSLVSKRNEKNGEETGILLFDSYIEAYNALNREVKEMTLSYEEVIASHLSIIKCETK